MRCEGRYLSGTRNIVAFEGRERLDIEQGLILDGALLATAPVSALLSLAPNALVRHGADKATARIRMSDSDAFAVIAHAGFIGPYPQDLAVVDGHGTDWLRAFSSGAEVEVSDVADDAIFNGTTNQTVLLDVGSRSLACFPILDRAGSAVGVISAHYGEDGSPEDHLDFARSLAHRISDRIATSGSVSEDQGPLALENMQLHEALKTRDVIAQAKGILMERLMVDEPAAIARLVKESQHANVKLRSIAAQIVAEHEQRVSDQRFTSRPGDT